MECPKCGIEVDNNALVCPNCKKVLKIICPVCRTINSQNVCKKCGEILVTKCSNCGKINLMKNQKCIKCGFSTEISALQAESNAETFAVVKIEFPNKDLIKTAYGSNKSYTRFMANLDAMINGYAKTLKIRRQILKDGTYVLRFNKAYTLVSSAKSAMDAVIDLANNITRLNVKLISSKNIILKTNFTILKKDADKDPYDLKSGFEANMLNHNSEKSARALDSCQIITDEDFYELYKDNYKLEALDSVLVNGKMKRFFEINIKEFIKIDDYMNELKAEELSNNTEVPSFVRQAIIAQDQITQKTIDDVNNEIAGEELYQIDLINFDEISCAFYSTENINILDNIKEVLNDVPTGIIGIKGSDIYQPYTLKLLSLIDKTEYYQNVIPITCHDNMKYSPYSFFRELISTVFEYSAAQKLIEKDDFSVFSNLDSDNLVKDLMLLKQRNMDNLEDTRSKYFSVFLSLLHSIPDTLIYIENCEKIDAGSMFVLNLLFEHFDDLRISYVISYDKSFSLHKNAHFLLSRPYYTEITLLPAPFKDIVNQNPEFYANILNDYYFKRIAKYASGSTLFLDYAIQYLVESGIYDYTDDSVIMINSATTMIPSGLSGLIQRRLNLMKDDIETLKFLSMCVLLGSRVDFKSASIFGFNNWKEISDRLADKGYLYYYNDCIYFPNYNLLKENILSILSSEELKSYSKELIDTAFSEDMPCPEKIFLYEQIQGSQNIIYEWEKLANLNLSMGDFSSYMNCSGRLIDFLDKYSDNYTPDELEKYKTSIYENISVNMFEYNPEQSGEIADKTLKDMSKSSNVNHYTNLCIKMVQGAIEHGEYNYALNLVHRVLAAMDKVSFDPSAQNFDLKYLIISVIHVKILFNIGAYDDCINIGYNILNVLDKEKIAAINYKDITLSEFKYLLSECIGYIAISDVVSLREDVGEFIDLVNKLFDFVPHEYQIFVQFQNLIKGEAVQLSAGIKGQNIFSNIFYHIIKAFKNSFDKPEEFAKEIYKSKIAARDSEMYNFELFCDLLIAYSYIGLNSYMKSFAMLNSIEKTAKDKGMNLIVFGARYVLSLLYMKQGKYDTAYGILNNSSIQMDKLGGISDYLLLLYKVNMYTLLMLKKIPDKAEICMNQAKYIVQKYGLKFNLNIDISKFMRENQNVPTNKEEN